MVSACEALSPCWYIVMPHGMGQKLKLSSQPNIEELILEKVEICILLSEFPLKINYSSKYHWGLPDENKMIVLLCLQIHAI